MEKIAVVVAACSTLVLTGCAQLMCLQRCTQHDHNATSLVEFLYPDGRLPPPSPELPQLQVPLRVGLAFLPSAAGQASGLDEAHKSELLERIRQRFASRRFIAEIVPLPDYYLAGQRGFAGLNGVQRLYDLDVMALVSFDQQTHLDQNKWSLAYLTIVGAYVVKGSRHDVSTLVDLAVVDPRSHRLILRAGGTDLRHGNTAVIDAPRGTREAHVAGFSAATDQMIGHFDQALTKFEADVRSGTAPVHILSKNAAGGSGGGGALGGGFLVLLLMMVTRRVSQP